jgi:Protein of unknown function (DUF3892)
MARRIICIDKDERLSPHERIQSVGGTNPDASLWWLTLDDTIAAIEEERLSFYVSVGGHTVEVIVTEHEGRKYLKTEADGYFPDNLLSLPDCK